MYLLNYRNDGFATSVAAKTGHYLFLVGDDAVLGRKDSVVTGHHHILTYKIFTPPLADNNTAWFDSLTAVQLHPQSFRL